MFHREMPSSGETNAGILALTAVSIAITVPFIFYFKSIADSLHTIAEDKSGYRKAKKYGE
ncbi:MAG: hypothetical protein JL56_15600 [Desulfotomaculum sp. BICA1-6]|nr:MAG: hypothetical protein VR67_18345 [Peptococcaceae bacterium BRH_c8a]KJS71119.1 MAG: hypothetical protein JL56_15600 [Desulfotomaculum sp. BICA1-6]